MATGALDANGIWLYGEDDSEPTASALLNKLGTSVSNVVIPASETAKGLVERATQNEVNTGTDTTRFVSPATARNATYSAYSMSAGTLLTSTAGLTTVTLPASRFGVAPIIIAEVTDHPNVCVTYVRNITSTNFQISAYTIAGGTVAATCSWVAVQMTSSNASG